MAPLAPGPEGARCSMADADSDRSDVRERAEQAQARSAGGLQALQEVVGPGAVAAAS